jgi:hypothetical protein
MCIEQIFKCYVQNVFSTKCEIVISDRKTQNEAYPLYF